MAQAEKIVLFLNKLAYSLQKIRNVQPSALAYLTDADITYGLPHLGIAANAFQKARGKLAEVFDELYEDLDGITVKDAQGNEVSFTSLLDGNAKDITFKVFQQLPEKALSLISQGDLYSTVLKQYLIENTVNEDGEKVLSEKDFTKPSKTGTSTAKEKPSIEVLSDMEDDF